MQTPLYIGPVCEIKIQPHSSICHLQSLYGRHGVSFRGSLLSLPIRNQQLPTLLSPLHHYYNHPITQSSLASHNHDILNVTHL